MSINLTLKRCDEIDNWYVLINKDTGDRVPYSVSVEGTKEEWILILAAILSGVDESFKRCAVGVTRCKDKKEFIFYSPRNSYETYDFYEATDEQVKQLIKNAFEED
jgi:hypothetical protein